MAIVTYLRIDDIPTISPEAFPPKDTPYRYAESPALIHVDCSLCKRHEVLDTMRAYLTFAKHHAHPPAKLTAVPDAPPALFDLTTRTHPR